MRRTTRNQIIAAVVFIGLFLVFFPEVISLADWLVNLFEQITAQLNEL
ncbi:MAG: hypothetical protein V7638_3916 [Acidobacteriota bacterium]|jgi:hypothetical protein